MDSNKSDSVDSPHEDHSVPIFHEKQRLQLCAQHALNNVLQEARFTKEDLDKICLELAPNNWINPHRSVFLTGNFDINVITIALQKCGKELIWFDKRRNPAEELNLDRIFGFMLNVPSKWKIMTLFNGKHWFALRVINGSYYDLNSNRTNGPHLIGKEADFLTYLRDQLKQPDTQLFLVLDKEVADSNSWRRNCAPTPNPE